MKNAPIHVAVVLIVVLSLGSPRASLAAGQPASLCSASGALGAIADGLSSTVGPGSHPEDVHTLEAALKSSAALRACGDEKDSISAELIAADAYSDVYPNDSRKQCATLRDARRRIRVLGDVRRAQMVTKTLAGAGCR